MQLKQLPELTNIAKPIIGYVGALSSTRLDIGLLAFIAIANPDWSIVLIGPEDNGFLESRLHQIKNIIFLGLKEASVLPDYINNIDVCINPQAVNEITIGNYPRKIDEYLALGKPVVAIETEGMLMFKDYTYLAETKEQFVKLVELALAEDSVEKQQARIEFAFSHSWENSVEKIYKEISIWENQV
ncbi:MAG: glycosyltransferase [Mucilaginibacter sp.]|uniref:glycosyltransferase n=1 Tax=Mucilaginibacter sp. TaxID=1882438 RepID=UPI0034E398C4